MKTLFTLALAAILFIPSAHAQSDIQLNEENIVIGKKEYSPYANGAFPTNVYFGDTHLHTSLSMDAGTFGNRLGLEESYRFTRGEQVTSSGGYQARLGRPLDFVVMADHSDGMGFFQMLAAGDPRMMDAPEGREWHEGIKEGGQAAADAAIGLIKGFSQGTLPWKTNDPELMKPIWEEIVEAAEKYNEPGKFTAFLGYEWTSLRAGDNLHRVVIYRDGADKDAGTLPYTAGSSIDPEDLWDYLQDYEDRTGGDVLAIAHNGNLSNGLMFDVETLNGEPLTRDYAERRQKWEPLYEITQIKGDGEAHPLLSPDDEFADYETWAFGNLDLSVGKTDEMLEGEYARSGLKRGLEIQSQVGVNPYKFGHIGSTDAHTSLPAVEENNFFGKASSSEPSPERMEHVFVDGPAGTIYGHHTTSSGYAAVWATENTRKALFDAMERKETYATTGPRMIVRFFGGWDYTEEDAMNRLPAAVGYAKGVPMGGDLRQGPSGGSPTFLVGAMKDPMSGNLDRVQIVKGWLDANGDAQERVYDVVVSGDREIGADGRARESVGNTVDVENATWTNSIGAPELLGVWKDPDFDPSQAAFYYARVIEIPTPRWTAYEAKFFGVEPPEGTEMTTTERAYTSPIWYNPPE